MKITCLYMSVEIVNMFISLKDGLIYDIKNIVSMNSKVC